ncbi:uroplakin-3b-like protein 2 isoform 2-T2 [Dugong dugon]
MGFSGGQFWLLMPPPLLLLTGLHSGTCLGTQNFAAPQRLKDSPAPADLPRKGYYLTLRANRALYPGDQASNQLQVLRVGNDTRCSPTIKGCNHPLPGPGPYRVKFLVLSEDRGLVAETEWSGETRLQQAEVLQAAPGPQTESTVVIITFLSVLLAVLLTALLALLIYTCLDTCGSITISGPEESVHVGRYNTHRMFSRPAVGAPSRPSALSLVQAAEPGVGDTPQRHWPGRDIF